MNTRYVAEFDPGLKVCPGLRYEYSVCLRARARLESQPERARQAGYQDVVLACRAVAQAVATDHKWSTARIRKAQKGRSRSVMLRVRNGQEKKGERANVATLPVRAQRLHFLPKMNRFIGNCRSVHSERARVEGAG